MEKGKIEQAFIPRKLSVISESIKLFIEDHAFLWSYDSVPRPPPFLPSSQQLVSLSPSSCVSSVELTNGRWGEEVGLGRGAKSYDRNTAWPSINHSMLSVYSYCERQIQLNMQFISPIILYTPYPLNVHNHLFYWI